MAGPGQGGCATRRGPACCDLSLHAVATSGGGARGRRPSGRRGVRRLRGDDRPRVRPRGRHPCRPCWRRDRAGGPRLRRPGSRGALPSGRSASGGPELALRPAREMRPPTGHEPAHRLVAATRHGGSRSSSLRIRSSSLRIHSTRGGYPHPLAEPQGVSGCQEVGHLDHREGAESTAAAPDLGVARAQYRVREWSRTQEAILSARHERCAGYRPPSSSWLPSIADQQPATVISASASGTSPARNSSVSANSPRRRHRHPGVR